MSQLNSSNTSPAGAAPSSSASTCPLIVKTSKAWVLPPRPKPGRKPTSSNCAGKEKKKKKEPKQSSAACSPSAAAHPEASTSKKTAAASAAQPTISAHPRSTSTPIIPGSTGAKHKQQVGRPAGTTSSQSGAAHTHTHAQAHGHAHGHGHAAAAAAAATAAAAASSSPALLNKNISLIESENSMLKDHLLALIHDYKHLKSAVLADTNSIHQPHHHGAAQGSVPTVRKRSFTELHASDPMNELIDNMNDLSHNPPALLLHTNNFDSDDLKSPEEMDEDDEMELFNFINLENTDNEDDDDDDDHHNDEGDSPFLSRTSSPSETDCENSLMTSLTRSTTVSTNNSSFMLSESHGKSKSHAHGAHAHPALHSQHSGGSAFSMFKDQPYTFYNLPNYGSLGGEDSAMAGALGFTFDKLTPDQAYSSMLKQDQYNMVTDFLEEKLIDNDMNYYVQTQNEDL